ncbi:MAG: M20 family metallopeptidase [Planctomycetota bacterium]|jgi:succinyl-diaminopimelate desuccinylase
MMELLRQLVQAESTPEKGELAVAQIISQELARARIDARIDCWDRNRANLVAHVESTGHKDALLFACHLDVVPPGQAKWEHPPFAGIESDGRIYGRGSADMKGGIVATLSAIKQIVESGVKLDGDIILTAAAGEETDSCGAKRFVSSYKAKLPTLAGVVLPEPTDFEVVTAHRGMLWLEVITRGKAAHGSTPELGVNAITSMKAILDELENYKIVFQSHELLGGCSMSINTISGGEAINVVPDKCSIRIDIRTVPGQAHQAIVDDFQRILNKLEQENPEFDAQVRLVREVGALEADANNKFVKQFCSAVGVDKTKAVGFTTDGPHFATLGAPVVIFGPGNPGLCHKPDEYIEIADVEKAVGYYKDIILKFLS